MSLDSEIKKLMNRYKKQYICITLDEDRKGYHAEIVANIPEYHLSPILKSMFYQINERIDCGKLYRNEKTSSKPDGRIRRTVCTVHNIFEKKL